MGMSLLPSTQVHVVVNTFNNSNFVLWSQAWGAKKVSQISLIVKLGEYKTSKLHCNTYLCTLTASCRHSSVYYLWDWNWNEAIPRQKFILGMVLHKVEPTFFYNILTNAEVEGLAKSNKTLKCILKSKF